MTNTTGSALEHASRTTPTSPLPPAGELALHSLTLTLRLAATRYRDASESCATASRAGDYEGCLLAQDTMRACRCQLEQAGRLDLIGGGR